MTDSNVTTLDDQAPVATAPVVSVTTKQVKKTKEPLINSELTDENPQLYMVTVHATGDDGGENAVDVCINGYLYQLPRGVPCKVPHAVLHGLENAIVTTYKVNGNEIIEKNTPRFPFSAVPLIG
jgi:hypothetical protein